MRRFNRISNNRFQQNFFVLAFESNYNQKHMVSQSVGVGVGGLCLNEKKTLETPIDSMMVVKFELFENLQNNNP